MHPWYSLAELCYTKDSKYTCQPYIGPFKKYVTLLGGGVGWKDDKEWHRGEGV